jgi:hypothetical protein
MPEQEELLLRVRLDDFATPQLRQLQREITQLGGGPSNLPRLKRKFGERSICYGFPMEPVRKGRGLVPAR